MSKTECLARGVSPTKMAKQGRLNTAIATAIKKKVSENSIPEVTKSPVQPESPNVDEKKIKKVSKVVVKRQNQSPARKS